MHIANIKSKLIASLALAAGAMTTGCTLVTDDLEPCPAQLRIKFVYDYNIKWGDAFAHEVSSVNVWAFEPGGGLVWSGSASGEALATGDFYLETPLTDGRYDFVAWCGLQGSDAFDLATYTPASREELEVTMRTLEEEGRHVSRQRLSGLFHASMDDVGYEIDPVNPTLKIVTAPLMKDTKDFRVLLQHLDGSEIEDRDFTVCIEIPNNSEYAWDNTLLPSQTVSYLPWNVRYGQTSGSGGDSRAMTDVSSLLFELSTGRLMEGAKAVLTVHRNWDDRDIIRIPLIEYLLLVKGHYGDISDQEYLDRQDEYTMTFFIDPNSNWYAAGGIYINGWAVVPPQDQDF